MGSWGIFKKLKRGLEKVGQWTKRKIIEPAYKKVIKPIIDTAVDNAPAIATVATTAITKNPQAGIQFGPSIGGFARDAGNRMGFGSKSYGYD